MERGRPMGSAVRASHLLGTCIALLGCPRWARMARGGVTQAPRLVKELCSRKKTGQCKAGGMGTTSLKHDKVGQIGGGAAQVPCLWGAIGQGGTSAISLECGCHVVGARHGGVG
ncbi:hypothetical protein R1flu_019289 [Riccia fluitans]|uniref:Secreted protein n=1 Tax=Riccia fluitans TaxID=41844 RepID=A0ABD1ZJS6_9MARC